MKRIFQKLVLGLLVSFIWLGQGLAYDVDLAKKFDAFFSNLTPEVIAKKPCMISVKDLFIMLEKKEPFVVLDIRTPQEKQIIKVSLPNTIEIPMHELFKEENLKKLPKDRIIVVICHTGTRAVAASLPLNILGYKTLVLDGGISELAKAAGRSVVGLSW
ncbi:rhodanese-like domain-containing protein [Thermodesulfobacterium sp. TA1]|uniref:rhodanese-like domain-containing protein n=1 Tax=Thermodesulfobacterium sp. TA1 TaxID=2234087 RepID=UPI0012327527|nr:rhodanese-like domain-containing protein [Thermodesulfobacterium sp. TA1]QER41405.1 rhodanese-like domain-containing protein [Thermodesulfobacterium sp. TA1]